MGMDPFIQSEGMEGAELPAITAIRDRPGVARLGPDWVACHGACSTLLLLARVVNGGPQSRLQSLREQRYGPVLDYFGACCARAGAGRCPRMSDAPVDTPPASQGRAVFFNPPGLAPPLETSLREALQLGRCLTLRPAALAEESANAWVTRAPGGYYAVRIATRGNKTVIERLHRLVLWCVYGPPPCTWKRQTMALHMCGNKECINPEHLAWGDRATNSMSLHQDDEAATNKTLSAYAALLKDQGRLPTR